MLPKSVPGRAQAGSEWLGDGRYRVTGSVLSAVPAEVAHAFLTDPELIRRWGLGGKSQFMTELTVDAAGLHVFTHRVRPMARISLYGKVLANEPYLVSRRYRNVHPRDEHRSSIDYERTVTYTLTPAPTGTLVRCEMTTTVKHLGEWGGTSLGRAEARSLAHSLDRLAPATVGRSPGLGSVLVTFFFPKTPLPP